MQSSSLSEGYNSDHVRLEQAVKFTKAYVI
jgi:hypothetical protein